MLFSFELSFIGKLHGQESLITAYTPTLSDQGSLCSTNPSNSISPKKGKGTSTGQKEQDFLTGRHGDIRFYNY